MHGSTNLEKIIINYHQHHNHNHNHNHHYRYHHNHEFRHHYYCQYYQYCNHYSSNNNNNNNSCHQYNYQHYHNRNRNLSSGRSHGYCHWHCHCHHYYCFHYHYHLFLILDLILELFCLLFPTFFYDIRSCQSINTNRKPNAKFRHEHKPLLVHSSIEIFDFQLLPKPVLFYFALLFFITSVNWFGLLIYLYSGIYKRTFVYVGGWVGVFSQSL
ncbi:hypothetical protein F4703DRAFT_1021416 [Phycomyces blakesleeanus]